jgi:predicted choloylglycine hydrolase
MNEHNITLLKQIITRRKEIYDFFVEYFGEDYPLTREIWDSIKNLTHLLSMAERRCKV